MQTGKGVLSTNDVNAAVRSFFFYLDLSCLCAFASCMPSFFYVPYVPSYFCMPYVPYVLSFITCLKCLHFFYMPSFFLYAFIFLRAYILFMCMLRKVTQIKELLLFIFAIIEFSHLSTFIKYFRFYKTRVIFCMIFSFSETKNIH